MSIKDFLTKIKGWISQKTLDFPEVSDDIFLGLIILLVAFGSFGLGRLSKIEASKTPIRIENAVLGGVESSSSTASSQSASAFTAQGSASASQLVGSKSGTKYHYPWCSGAKTISEANKIYFSSKADAEARGYTPASNCKGL